MVPYFAGPSARLDYIKVVIRNVIHVLYKIYKKFFTMFYQDNESLLIRTGK